MEGTVAKWDNGSLDQVQIKEAMDVKDEFPGSQHLVKQSCDVGDIEYKTEPDSDDRVHGTINFTITDPDISSCQEVVKHEEEENLWL